MGVASFSGGPLEVALSRRSARTGPTEVNVCCFMRETEKSKEQGKVFPFKQSPLPCSSALTPPTLPLGPTKAQHSHAFTHRYVSCPGHGLCAVLPSHSLPTPRSALTPPLVTHLNNPRAHARRHSHTVLQSCLRCQCSPLLLPLGQSFYGGVASACTGRHST